MFIQDKLYLVKTQQLVFLGIFAGYNEVAKPFLQFNNVTSLTEGHFTHFMKTGDLSKDRLKGCFAFKSGIWIRDNWIHMVIEVGVVPRNAPKLQEVPKQSDENNQSTKEVETNEQPKTEDVNEVPVGAGEGNNPL